MHCDTASVIEWSKRSSRCAVQTLVAEVEYPPQRCGHMTQRFSIAVLPQLSPRCHSFLPPTGPLQKNLLDGALRLRPRN